jgi:Uma2 family endonuclease
MTMHVDPRPARRYARPPRRLEFPSEAEVPESKRHLELRTTLYLILKHALRDRAIIGSDQFVYWDATDPSACLAPDVFVRLGGKDQIFSSWKTWERGAPHLAVEIVSASDADPESWGDKLAKYHRLGISELVRFDVDDRAAPLRVWDYIEGDLVERDLVPGASTECASLGLFWVVLEDEELGLVLRLSRDAAGYELFPIEAYEAKFRASEAARNLSDRERRTAESERDAALELVRGLEQEQLKRR